MQHKPIKRAIEMQGVSRDHHHALLLSWKINKGIEKNVEPQRIIDYVHWFRNEYLLPHFEIEEKWMFPILGNENEKVQRALNEHVTLLNDSLSASNFHELEIFAENLKNHIRFEERDLFQDIQLAATKDELKLIEQHHNEGDFCERTQDEFWL
ncbi:MAG: hemerythrin domain-containing protein [Flavobacteriaceae bacterium]|nr:hemerythrin domain-containing protein [Flavobacteriaceae bacterium]